MRTMLRVHMEAIKGSEALKSGALQKAFMGFAEKFKPEVTYFTLEAGMRSAFFVFDMKSSQQMPEIGEPFFDLGCTLVLTPCMTPEDLQAGFAAAGL